MRAVAYKADPRTFVARHGYPWVVKVGRIYALRNTTLRGIPMAGRIAPIYSARAARRAYFPTHAAALAYAIAATSGREDR